MTTQTKSINLDEKIQSVNSYWTEARFSVINKQKTLADYIFDVNAGEYWNMRVQVCYEIHLTHEEFNIFTGDLLQKYQCFDGKGNEMRVDINTPQLNESEHNHNVYGVYYDDAIVIIVDNTESIVVNPQGYDYPRHIGIIGSLPR